MSAHPFKLAPVALATALGIGAMASSAAMAQSAPAAAGAEATYNIHLQAQPLGNALNELARQAGLQLLVRRELVKGKQAPAVSGQLTRRQALDRLLTGSGLLATIDAATVVVRPAPARNESEATLSSITVTASAELETATDPVRGYLAQRSITATKADIPLIETPQSVSVATADQIEIQSAESLHQALRYTPGVQQLGINDTSANGMTIRGFNVTAAAPMYMNGAKLARSSFSGVAEPYALERLEVLKGPASVLYGNASPGGIVNMVTKQPQAEPLRELKFQLGSFDRKQIAGDFAGKLNDDATLTYRLTGLVRRSDTAVDHVPDDRNFGMASIRWAPNEGTAWTLFLHRQHNETLFNPGLPFSGTVASNPNGRIDRSRFVGEPGFNRFETSNTTFGYQLSHRIDDTFTFRQNVLGFDSDTDYADNSVGALDGTGRLLSRNFYSREDDERSWSIDNQLEAKWRTGSVEHTTLVGLDYVKQDFARLQFSGTAAPLDVYAPVYGTPVTLATSPTADFDSTSKQLGLYAQQHMKFDNRWVLTLGGRYDKVKAKEDDHRIGVTSTTYDDDALTGRIGLVRLFESGWAPYVSYAQSFEPASGRTASGSAFKPTEGEQYEIGMRFEPTGKNFSLSGSVYHLRQQNVTTSDIANPGFSVQEGEVLSKGVELEARAHLGSGLSMIASYGYVDNAITKSNSGTQGRTFGGVPRHSAALWLDYDVNEAIGIGAGARYFGTSENFTNTVDIPGFTVVDAVLNYKLTPDWKLVLNISNIFDKRYVTCSFGFTCYYGTPRSASATLTYRWQ